MGVIGYVIRKRYPNATATDESHIAGFTKYVL